MFCNKLLSLYQTVWSRRICFSFQMTMKDWRKATNKNIPVLSYHFFFSMDLRLGSWISAEFLPSFAVLLPPFSKDFVVFTWVLISSQTLTILSLPWFLWRLDVRIYEGKPVPKPMKSVLTCPFFSDNLCLQIANNSCFSNTSEYQICLFCCVARTHHHIQLNDCTRPVVMNISDELVFMKHPNFSTSISCMKVMQLQQGVLRGDCGQGQGHSLGMGEEERAFPCIAPHGTVQARSHWMFPIIKTRTSVKEGPCIHTEWIQDTKSHQSLLSLAVCFWNTTTLFWSNFQNLSGGGWSHQPQRYIKTWWCISNSMAFVTLPFVLTCAHG